MPAKFTITRSAIIPDLFRLERYRNSPAFGPRLLFFSGGTALKRVAKQLISYTHNSIHLITAFDSGGSSAKLRQAFNMISVGDIRNRLMALADQSVKGNPDVYRAFAYRFSSSAPQAALQDELASMLEGQHELIIPLPHMFKKIIINHLHYFYQKMPPDFDLRGANIGNLILAGGYVNNNYDLEPVIFVFSKLAEVRGLVKPVYNRNLHLAAHLSDGRLLIGQHLITGKEAELIDSPIKDIFLCATPQQPQPVKTTLTRPIAKLIEKADVICYPMGSFYSSLLVNFLVEGVGQSVAANICPKVYVPNTFFDPEQQGLSLSQSVSKLLHYLGNGNYPVSDLLNFVVIDSKNLEYPFELDTSKLEELGIVVIDTELVTKDSYPFICPDKLIGLLLSLA